MKRSAPRSNPETARAWEERTRATRRTRAQEQPVRTAPLRRRGKRANAAHGDAFGPQSDLCRRLPCETCLAEALGVHIAGDVTEHVKRTLLYHATFLAAGDRLGGHAYGYGSEPHHFPCRPIGKDKDAGPECRRHHAEWHDTLGARGHARKYRIDLRRIRAALARRLNESNAP